jgi:hypothetical protein
MKGELNGMDEMVKATITSGIPYNFIYYELDSHNLLTALEKASDIIKEKKIKHLTVISSLNHLYFLKWILSLENILKKYNNEVLIRFISYEKNTRPHTKEIVRYSDFHKKIFVYSVIYTKILIKQLIWRIKWILKGKN